MLSFALFISLSIVFSYHPRSRPARPILPRHLQSTIKISPEEWYRVTSTMQTRHGSNIQPIQCNVRNSLYICCVLFTLKGYLQLYIPSVQIYAVSDIIPFHVRLCASASSLHALQRPVNPENSSRRNSFRAQERPIARVFLVRQIIATAYGHKARRDLVIGEGVLQPLPPLEIDIPPTGDGSDSLNWGGEVRCDERVTVGAFNVADLYVKVRSVSWT
jgi:hypothetical protein